MKDYRVPKRTGKQLAVQVMAAAILSLAVVSFMNAAPMAITGMAVTGRGCQGNQICDVITDCTTSGCSNKYENCQGCGTAVKVCGTEVVTAPNICSEEDGAASCYAATPTCSDTSTPDPHVVLTFDAFTKKNLLLNVTPKTAAGLAGSTLNYRIGIENKNPKTLQLVMTAQIPPSWTINIPEETSVAERAKKEVIVRITSNETASDNTYPIIFGVYNRELGLFASTEVTYVVGSRGAPGINTTPQVNKGYPGQTIMYNVTVTNNDPEGFDPSTISLKALSPAGFNAVFSPASIKVAAGGQSASIRLDVTSPANATENEYELIINATANKLSGLDFIKYAVDFCGNNVCDAGEEIDCTRDCPTDPFIICNGRCETELDDGLQFAATVTIPYQKFVICNRNSTQTACFNAAKANACGAGKACLCTNNRPECKMRCVDTKGIYYIFLNGTEAYRSVANYSYACPYVDLAGFKVMRDDFQKAKEDYEKARSALKESLKRTNMTIAEKAELQPCADALSTIISMTDAFLKHAAKVIDWPGKANTTAARERADILREEIEKTYNAYCRGASGLLQIDKISIAMPEKDAATGAVVDVRNVGNTPYYGFVSCDLTGGDGEKETVDSTCELIDGSRTTTFSAPFVPESSGSWKARCKAMGSLLSDCSYPAIHDDKTNNFTVFTKETYVVSVSGSCGSQVNCSVRTTRPGCGACSINGMECTRTGTVNNTDTFICDKPPSGVYTLFGYVINTENCKPVEPAIKNTTVKCPGCGDGAVEGDEQCELPYTDNNEDCVQEDTACLGKLFAVRDKAGFCTVSCGCSYDEYEVSCTRGKCGSECIDGETKVVTLNKTGGTCTCTQQCGSGCTWNPCECETGTTVITGVPTVLVSHSNPSGGLVTITATGTSATTVEIYVDGYIVRTCNSFPCSVTATYDAGVHYYYARAVNPLGVDTDPDAGSKSFTISGTGTGGTGTGTGGSGLNTSTVMLDISVSPTGTLTSTDTVILTAVGNGPRSFREINIYVDGELKKVCTNYPRSVPCTYRTSYPAGTYNYYASATDAANTSVRDPDTGSESFTVIGNVSTSGSSSSGTGTGGGTTTTGKCYARIENKSCTYNSATRRYDIFISATWFNGTHAHIDVEDNSGPKIYANAFNRTESMAGPGLKSVKLLVHDVDDKSLCFASETIYCGPGTATGRDVDIIFDVKNVISLNATNAKLIIVPYKDIDFARITNLVQEPMDLTVFGVSGNRTIMGLSEKTRIFDNRSFLGNSVSGSLRQGINITIDYAIIVKEPGEYTLMAVANYSGKAEKFTKKIKATNCPQINSVLAKYGDACKEFTTICDKPANWVTVESCSQSSEPIAPEGESPLAAGIGVAVIALAGALGYKYRFQIREKINSLKKKKEEEVSIDFGEK